MELPASSFSLQIPFHYGGHYTFDTPSDNPVIFVMGLPHTFSVSSAISSSIFQQSVYSRLSLYWVLWESNSFASKTVLFQIIDSNRDNNNAANTYIAPIMH